MINGPTSKAAKPEPSQLGILGPHQTSLNGVRGSVWSTGSGLGMAEDEEGCWWRKGLALVADAVDGPPPSLARNGTARFT